MTMRYNISIMSATLLVLSLTWCLRLRFVHCAQPRLRLNSSEHDILKTLYDSSGGSEGRWNYAGMESCLASNYRSNLIGREWSFTKNATGAYVEDPCQKDIPPTKPFMGVFCSCDASTCWVENLALPCGGLRGTIPWQLSELRYLTVLDLDTNSLTGLISLIPIDLLYPRNWAIWRSCRNSICNRIRWRVPYPRSWAIWRSCGNSFWVRIRWRAPYPRSWAIWHSCSTSNWVRIRWRAPYPKS